MEYWSSGGARLPKELNSTAKGSRVPMLYRLPGRLRCRSGGWAWHENQILKGGTPEPAARQVVRPCRLKSGGNFEPSG